MCGLTNERVLEVVCVDAIRGRRGVALLVFDLQLETSARLWIEWI